MFLTPKAKDGIKRWYLRENARIDGESKRAWEVYLGTAELIYKKIMRAGPDINAISIRSFQYGKIGAVLAVNDELGFTDIVDRIVPKLQKKGVLTAGQYLLAFIAGRMHKPVSKNGMQKWFDKSYFKFLWKFNHTLSCQNFLNQMAYLDDDRMKTISREICKQLVKLGYEPDTILFDTTNFSTEMDPDEDDEDRTLAKPGFAKDGKFQNNLIGTAIATTNDNLPFPIDTYPGNRNDYDVINHVVDDLLNRIEEIKPGKSKKISLVIDKGCNSKDTIDKMRGKVSLIGSLRRCDYPKLMKIPMTKYNEEYITNEENKIKLYRTKDEVFGKIETVVVEYNGKSQKKQKLSYENVKEKFLNEVEGIKKSLEAQEKGTKKGRPLTEEGIRNRLYDVVPKKWRGVLKFYVGTTLEKKLDVRGWIVEEKEKELLRGFGKTIYFSTRDDLSSEEIAKTYKSLHKIEEDFHFLKDKVLIPVTPINHQDDLPIKVHIFLCVIGLLFYRYMLLKLKSEGVTISELVDALEEIKVGVVVSKDLKKAWHVVEEMDKLSSTIFSVFRLDRYVKK